MSIDFANPLYFLAAVGMVVLARLRRWIDMTEFLVAAALLGLPYCLKGYTSCMLSHARYSSVCIPLHLALGSAGCRWPGWILIAVGTLFGTMQAVYLALYGASYRIY